MLSLLLLLSAAAVQDGSLPDAAAAAPSLPTDAAAASSEPPAVAFAPPPVGAAGGVAAAPSASPARPRVELQAALGVDVGGSSWSGDALGHGTLLVGLRLFRIVGLFGMARVGYGAVDQRLLTFLTLGLQLGYLFKDAYYPYLRLGGVHQHEESLASAAQNPWGTLFGIGTGIRHRAGLVGSVGCDFVLRSGKRGALSLGPEVALSYLTYSSGPSVYGFVGAQLGGALTIL